MTSATNTCVAWLLLGSYIVLLGVGGFGVWVTVNNFGVDEPLPPTPPVENTTTTTTPEPYGYQRSDLMKYHDATEKCADNFKDPRLYVGVPCSVSVLLATCVLVAGLCSRKFFTTTFSLYSLVALWAGNIWLTCTYQSNVGRVDQEYFHQTVGWVLGFQIGLLVLLLLQVLLSVWELRRQKANWPTINLSRLFTVDALLLIARLSLSVITLLTVIFSQLMSGIVDYTDPSRDYNERPVVRYPPYLAIIILASALYGLVVIVESMGSYFFGILSSRLTSFTCLLSALCYGTIAVLSSQVVVKALLVPSVWVYSDVMNSGIATSVVSFLHLVSCLFFSTAARTPPSIIKKVIDILKSGDFLSVNFTDNSESFVSGVGSLRKSLWNELGVNSLRYNLGSAVFSILSIVILASTWWEGIYRTWGSAIVLCADFAILARTLPPVVMELHFHKPAGIVPNLQGLMNLVVENLALLVGSLGILFKVWSAGHKFCAVASLLFFLFQCLVIRALVKARTAQTPETKPLTEDEPEESGLQDEDEESGLQDEESGLRDKESGFRDEDERKNLPEALA